MAQSDLAEKIGINELQVESTDVMTGDRNKSRFLYYQLKVSMLKADKIDIIVSFLMESGVRMILKDLKAALDRGVQIRILTGNYLGITQPSALCLIKKELGNRIDLRFYNDKGRSFHPKSYIFHYENAGEIYIGSSNISKSALTSGIEWNYRFSSLANKKSFQLFYETFVDLFENHSIVIDDEELIRYSKSWHKPAVSKDLAKYDDLEEDEDTKVKVLFQPRGAQIEALYALEDSRAEGATKGLIQAATGVGKTYLAAFDSAKYERVLFVAHREEILKQAAVSFQNVRHSSDYGFFNGKQKDTDKAVIFASVSTLGRSEYLTDDFFAPDYFDYLIIDEFHHAVNAQYQRIVNYFKPQFLMGLTATPERMDGKNIYEICDYNVPYEISLKEAINKGMLVPFHYYGIYDETDYSSLHFVKGRYNEKELNETYIGNVKRCDLIYKYYMKYHSKRALGFCCSRRHAEAMAKEFCKRGIKAAAVYSNADGEFSEDRDRAVEKLKNQEIKVIFSVDMFNEGVDIAALDMVMFLRPTESPIVFLQQLGRGLRTSKGKEYLNVLDFIGNYERAGRAPFLLSGDKSFGRRTVYDYHAVEYPDDCIVDFDIRLIDLFKELDKKPLSVKEKIKKEFYRVKELLDGRVPTRMELFTYIEDEIYEYCIKHARENPFRRYMEFVNEMQELSVEEEEVYSGIGREFLSLLETTDMQKVYKMPILYSFYNGGNVRLAVTDSEVLEVWKRFFDSGTNWKDFAEDISYEEYKAMTDKQHLSKAKSMPIKFLKASGKGFFIEKEGYALAIREDLDKIIDNEAFRHHMKDILEYRTMEYYRRRYIGKSKKMV
ncbi:MAG: DEAD/DEAH box helicase family protein [Lachnospiraceae bacterium]